MDDESNEIVSTFDRKGAHIILGNSRGLVMIKKFPQLEILSLFRITTGTNTNAIIKHIEIPRRGQSQAEALQKRKYSRIFRALLFDQYQ